MPNIKFNEHQKLFDRSRLIVITATDGIRKAMGSVIVPNELHLVNWPQLPGVPAMNGHGIIGRAVKRTKEALTETLRGN